MNEKTNGPLIICLSSGKGGVGKTSIAVNLATSIAKQGKRILLIDGDLGLANVDIVLGLNAQHTLRELIEEGLPLTDILIEVAEGFFVLPASSGVPEMANLAIEEQAFLTDAVERIIGDFDYVLVDTAAGLGDSVLWFNQWASFNIVILTPDPTSMTDAYALIKVLKNQYGKDFFHLVVNSVRSKKEGQSVFDNIGKVLETFLGIKPQLLGFLPQDSSVTNGIRSQKPFCLQAPNSKAGKAIVTLAQEVIRITT